MQWSAQGFGKMILTVVGIVLLVVFGMRAASQASSLAAVGGPGAKKSNLPVASVRQLAVVADSGAYGSQSFMPATTQQNTDTSSAGSAPGNKPGPVNNAVASIKKDVQKVATDTGGQPAKRPHVK